jgi:integrase
MRGAGAKSGQTRHVPLNSEAVQILQKWMPASAKPQSFVFAGEKEGDAIKGVKKAWAGLVKKAKMPAFRFHDLRHTFASKLVMAGVDLNTVRELLGHSDISITLRYANLAPEHKAAAVEKLVPITRAPNERRAIRGVSARRPRRPTKNAVSRLRD